MHERIKCHWSSCFRIPPVRPAIKRGSNPANTEMLDWAQRVCATNRTRANPTGVTSVLWVHKQPSFCAHILTIRSTNSRKEATTCCSVLVSEGSPFSLYVDSLLLQLLLFSSCVLANKSETVGVGLIRHLSVTPKGAEPPSKLDIDLRRLLRWWSCTSSGTEMLQ